MSRTPCRPGGFQPTPVFRELRRKQLAAVEMRDSAGNMRPVMVCDVSSRGLGGIAAVVPPAPNEIITVTLPDGRPFMGIVRWVEDGQFGVEFAACAGTDEAESDRATSLPILPN